MISPLPKWNLRNNAPSFYSTDAVTMLELAARLHASMNKLIDDYNERSEALEARLTEFETGAREDMETHETSIRQEFQDFIDIVNLKVLDVEQAIENLSDQIANISSEKIKEEVMTEITPMFEEINNNFQMLVGEVNAEFTFFAQSIDNRLNEYYTKEQIDTMFGFELDNVMELIGGGVS